MFLKRNMGKGMELSREGGSKDYVWCPYSQPGPQHALPVKVSGVIVLQNTDISVIFQLLSTQCICNCSFIYIPNYGHFMLVGSDTSQMGCILE